MQDPRVQDWNLTIEKEVMPAFRRSGDLPGQSHFQFAPTAGSQRQHAELYLVCHSKKAASDGNFASVATRPYDQQVWGTVNKYQTTGWENFEGAQLEFERRFNHGVGFQVFWVLANTLAAASETTVPSMNTYLPGSVPTDFDGLNRFLNYRRDTTAPQQTIRWNWVAELPFGKGKALWGGAHGVTDKLIGGWQIAGTGQWRTNYIALPTSIYPTGTPIEQYGYNYPIQDCRSGICYPGYLYWNGYIPANQINSHDASGRPNGVEGFPPTTSRPPRR